MRRRDTPRYRQSNAPRRANQNPADRNHPAPPERRYYRPFPTLPETSPDSTLISDPPATNRVPTRKPASTRPSFPSRTRKPAVRRLEPRRIPSGLDAPGSLPPYQGGFFELRTSPQSEIGNFRPPNPSFVSSCQSALEFVAIFADHRRISVSNVESGRPRRRGRRWTKRPPNSTEMFSPCGDES